MKSGDAEAGVSLVLVLGPHQPLGVEGNKANSV